VSDDAIRDFHDTDRARGTVRYGARATQRRMHVNFLVQCQCGHSLEEHLAGDGCRLCACTHDRSAALDLLVEALRNEQPAAGAPVPITRRTSTGSVLRRVDASP
jgi:hypothetical protein